MALPIVDTAGAPAVGDCVDCKMCVTTCPTGIDIRDGLQLECVGCAQCIDACDAVMSKLERPKGLIRYSSQNAMEGRPKRIVRVRTVLYATVLTAVFSLFVTLLVTAKVADADVFRGRGNPFTVLETGEVVNNLRVRVTNRGEAARSYRVEVIEPKGARLTGSADVADVQPGKFESAPLSIAVPFAAFNHGHATAAVRVSDDHGFTTVLRTALLGPEQAAATSKPEEKHEERHEEERTHDHQ